MSPEHMAAIVSPSATTQASAGTWDTSQLPDPCRTLTEAEVTATLGAAVTRTSNRESWPPLCAYALTGGMEFLYVSDNSQPSGREDFESDKSIASGGEPVAALGDAAFWSTEPAALGVMSGKTYVVLKFGGSALPKQAKEKAVALARLALPRIGS